ncbi:RILP-like protein 1 [Carlito syrichta]|uniref:RILP-like protein 1 n=1 Tax=Carlito syrichta TaxID=1868482 RepID=A0A1U7SLB5_CARSF|nr:RILP-like protein 1 [Carlito syrichta]
MDVYDIASLVGHEFERVIDQHGCEAIARLMPKVVRVLEILEVLVSRHHVAPELDELRLELDRLRLERVDRIEKERKHQKELELVEDVWRGEAQDLLSQIAQLQEENKQLMTNLSHKDVSFSEEEFQKHEGHPEASGVELEIPLLAPVKPQRPQGVLGCGPDSPELLPLHVVASGGI